MRISDWSSDVCSSDLGPSAPAFLGSGHRGEALGPMKRLASPAMRRDDVTPSPWFPALSPPFPPAKQSRKKDRIAGLCRPHGLDQIHLPKEQKKAGRSDEHKSELQSLLRISYAGFCW